MLRNKKHAATQKSPRARGAAKLSIKATKLPKISETAEHRTIASWVRKLGPGGTAVMFHLRGERHGYNQRAIAARMGVLSKLPDWCVIDGGRVGFIELKPRGWKTRTDRTGTFTPHEREQLKMHARLRRAGAWVELAETLDEVQCALVRYGVPLRNESETIECLKRVFAEPLP